jgi:hypothetical protein
MIKKKIGRPYWMILEQDVPELTAWAARKNWQNTIPGGGWMPASGFKRWLIKAVLENSVRLSAE